MHVAAAAPTTARTATRRRTLAPAPLFVFAALDLAPAIDYVDMPAHLKGKYQYHTCAAMAKARAAGYTRPFTRLEDAVADYVRNHLVDHVHLAP